MKNLKTTGQRIKFYRQAQRLTQKQLAELVGVAHNTISSWENDSHKPDIEMIHILCEKLNITPSELMGHKKNEGASISELVKPIDFEFLKKYEALDQRGKEIVDYILNKEYERCTEKSNNKVIIFPMFEANKNEKPIKTVELDYYPMAAGMGSDRYVENIIPEKITYPENLIPENTDFVINVSGNSMEPTFYSGDKLFIQATDHLNKGEVGVFNYMGEQLVKECGDGVLISHNPDYKPIEIKGDCYVQGKVLGRME